MTESKSPLERFNAARITYNYCGICGHIPKNDQTEPNRAPLRWWDPDDGWKIGSLCRHCAEDYLDSKPKKNDFAVVTKSTNGIADDINTDEDPAEAI